MEKHARRILWRLIAWRILSDIIKMPRRILEAVAGLAFDLELALFYKELEAAREYKLLTGCDMGAATGDHDRYAGVVRQKARRM